ncbi:thioredoxin family protein [Candidatus Bipolaricaulota bacterium]|nr:thioredoxin family protein [Candidatus Bipolaricaulota bacterium]
MNRRALVLVSLMMVGVALAVGATQVELQYFWSTTCPDCQIMWDFLRGLQEEYSDLVIVDHEVTFNPDNWRLMVTLAGVYELDHVTTPTVFVGELAVTGIGRAVELRIRQEVERCLEVGCPSPMERLPKRRAWVLSPLEILALIAVGILVFLYLSG